MFALSLNSVLECGLCLERHIIHHSGAAGLDGKEMRHRVGTETIEFNNFRLLKI